MISKDISVSGKEFKIFGFPSDPYFESIETHLQHGNFFIPLLANYVKPGSRLIDVGANVGGTTALMHTFVKDAQVIAIEPSRMFECLKATVAANAFTNTSCVNACVGEKDSIVKFVDCGDYDGGTSSSASHSHISVTGSEGSISIHQKKLDTIVKSFQLKSVDLVKIDVEGFEENVIDGMSHINASYKPVIFMEYNSYTLSVHAKKSPYSILEKIFKQFGGFVGMRDGRPKYFGSEADIRGFLYDNMTKSGCVEDIAFSVSPDFRAALAL